MISLPGHYSQCYGKLAFICKIYFPYQAGIYCLIKNTETNMERLIEISFRFHKCNKQILKYYGGTTNLVMKCERCKRILDLKKFTQDMIVSNAKDGIFKI